MKTAFQLIEEHGLTLHGDIEHFAELVRADERARMAEQPAQQEPVAYIHRQGNHYEVSERFLSDDEKSRGWTEEPLYTSPPAQPAQQQESVAALQRVMARLADLLDEDQFAEIEGIVARSGVSPPAQPRKPLPFNKEDMEGLDVNQRLGFKLGWKSAEEAHGIKENT